MDATKQDNDLQEQYKRYREELVIKQNSNSEQYDKYLLTFSVGFLTVSVSFLSKFIIYQQVDKLGLLYFSWAFLLLSIIITLISFFTSNKSIKQAIKNLNDGKDYSHANPWIKWTEYFNNSSGLLFILGLLLTIIFVGLFISKQQNMMKQVPNINNYKLNFEHCMNNSLKINQNLENDSLTTDEEEAAHTINPPPPSPPKPK